MHSLFTMECIHSHFQASSLKFEILLKSICFKHVGPYMAKSFQCTWHNVKSGLTGKIHKLGFRWAGQYFTISGSLVDLYIVLGVTVKHSGRHLSWIPNHWLMLITLSDSGNLLPWSSLKHWYYFNNMIHNELWSNTKSSCQNYFVVI
jgi:hypothetical protein